MDFIHAQNGGGANKKSKKNTLDFFFGFCWLWHRIINELKYWCHIQQTKTKKNDHCQLPWEWKGFSGMSECCFQNLRLKKTFVHFQFDSKFTFQMHFFFFLRKMPCYIFLPELCPNKFSKILLNLNFQM